MKQLLFPEDVQFWYETLRLFGHTSYGGSEFGEILSTSEKITVGDYDSWHDAWLATAERVAAEAARSLEAGHEVSARDGYLRAATYYRSAEFFLHGNPDDPRVEYAYTRNVECFHAAAALYTPAIESVEIPYEGTVLRGYFYRAAGEGPKPTMVMHNGFDGSAEEMHFFGALAGQERGYHVLTFDGPGQPSAIHREKLPFRPDWENVVGPVLDFLAGNPAVDPARIALLGISLGGMLAPRAAAFEPRIAAVIAVDGVYDATGSFVSALPFGREELERRARAEHDAEFDAILAAGREASPVLRWACDQGRYVMGAASDREFLGKYLDYHLRDGVAERITCPTLVCSAEEDLFFAGDGENQAEPEALFEHLTCEKTLMTFTVDEGADAHCHVGAQRLAMSRIYDWLAEVLR
ncbi:alpha/beta hydrolase family protein [Amycolatopsis sp. H20-H5]|uniref:alpha/beta hydrolase family protein n=1 Tax=Amycolatopsis sp. H20-H5 TaxID=3046309 RepID=UPI002DBB1560|nr:alpha/beta fold hydrolase [Amycolatopsis sp. H20-H5]MEC3981209.1 alpha/beta fold hydrolase [Amycolatopsis sp. H20-H5]